MARSGKRRSEGDVLAREAFWRAAQYQRVCAMCGAVGNQWQAHHVIYEQHVVGAGHPPFDERNSMRLCTRCHERHHSRAGVVPLVKLTVVHIEYAFEVLGLGAHHYLLQRYEGPDERVDQALAKAEADGRSSPAPV